jgi:hypothetical protein
MHTCSQRRDHFVRPAAAGYTILNSSRSTSRDIQQLGGHVSPRQVARLHHELVVGSIRAFVSPIGCVCGSSPTDDAFETNRQLGMSASSRFVDSPLSVVDDAYTDEQRTGRE